MMASSILNLWDMLERYAATISILTTGLLRHEERLQFDLLPERVPRTNILGFMKIPRPAPVSAGDEAFIQEYLPHAERLASDLDLDAVEVAAKRIRNGFAGGSYQKRVLIEDVRSLRMRLHDQLTAKQFIYVAPQYVELYQRPALFGQKVNDRFPAAIDDIQDAGTALALGLGTSCVMHLMRVMEVGLKVLAKELGVPYATSWDAYLTKIEQSISAKHSMKSAEWKQCEAFYRDVSGDLLTIKQAWRNPTMHTDRRYSPDEAGQIFSAVGTLMQRMAQNLMPKEQPILTLIANSQASDGD